MFAVERILNKVLVNLDIELIPVLASHPRLGEFVRASWGVGARADNSLPVAGHRSEKIGRCLMTRTDEAEIFEVGFGLVGAAKVDLPSFVQKYNFVKNLCWGISIVYI